MTVYYYNPKSDSYHKVTDREWAKVAEAEEGMVRLHKSDYLSKLAAKPESSAFRVSQSKVKTWRKCRRAYHLKYVDKLRRRRKPRALVFGTLVHQVLERHLQGDDDPLQVLDQIDVNSMKLFSAEKEEYLQTLQDAKDIMVEYLNHWDNDPLKYVSHSGKASEHSFEIEILPSIIWNGKIDGIGRSSDKLRWIIEHKTFKKRPSADDRWRNLQSVTYVRAIDILGWGRVDGMCWDYIWSKPPVAPLLLKSGQLSKKKQDTLPVVFRRAIKEHGLNRTDYRTHLAEVAKNREQWFSRVKTPLHKSVVDDVYGDFISTVKEMADLHGQVKDRNIERHCSWCDFEPLCRAQMQGLDHEYVKEREYEISSSPQRDDEEVHSVSFDEL